ncbi:hypothetical protein [Kineococcus sp. SYSU DK004]|uniref:hypothetical protein n=1 Tax=Kineococcus sp. SYSU DK004 TaxID=3383125 RepID=UPI003D7DB265
MNERTRTTGPTPRPARRRARRRVPALAAVAVLTAGLAAAPAASAATAPPGVRAAPGAVTLSPRPAVLPETCRTATPPVSPCGYGTIDVRVSGLAAAGDRAGGGIGFGGAAGVTLEVRCGTSTRSTWVRTQVPVGPVWPRSASTIGPATRVDADTAVLRAGFTLPSSGALGACRSTTTVVRAWSTGASVVLDGLPPTASGATSTTVRVSGTPQFPRA